MIAQRESLHVQLNDETMERREAERKNNRTAMMASGGVGGESLVCTVCGEPEQQKSGTYERNKTD